MGTSARGEVFNASLPAEVPFCDSLPMLSYAKPGYAQRARTPPESRGMPVALIAAPFLRLPCERRASA